MQRSSGILMHITSLPSPYGIGTMGDAAFTFADFLQAANQRYWQVLPLGPTGFGDSPYQCFSSFAGNPYLIDLDLLREDGLLCAEDLQALPSADAARYVDYGALSRQRAHVLQRAFENGHRRDAAALDAFVEHAAHWLPDYALFMALKTHFGMRAWLDWEDADIRRRCPESMAYYRELLQEDVRFHCYMQYLFFQQWERLRSYCHARRIHLIGDIPIYVALDSADVWAAPELFQLDESLRPTHVAGVPPDYFSQTGQLWGNPLYNWDAMHEDGFAWWIRRIAAAKALYDAVRIDHFRGLCSYWSVPFGNATAEHGTWMAGPGMAFISMLHQHFADLPIIAEDLGILTEDVHTLLRESGFPGMKVLQFAFDNSWKSTHLPHQYERNCVCYAGTHDNDTLAGFLYNGHPAEVALAVEYLGLNVQEGLHWGFIRGGMASPANLFICQMQDILELPMRMNRPGTVSGNWQWRMLPGEIPPHAAKRLARYTAMFGRE